MHEMSQLDLMCLLDFKVYKNCELIPQSELPTIVVSAHGLARSLDCHFSSPVLEKGVIPLSM